MAPIIGIFPNVENGEKSSVQNTYVYAIKNSGGTALMLPYTKSSEDIERFVELCDGFLFTGGVDVEPIRYGEEKSPFCGECAPMRDEIELLGFSVALGSGKPILAICRGCQLINVALGGTLYQDIESEYKTDVRHRLSDGNYSHAHSVKLIQDSPLHGIIGEDFMTVNSMHHQAVKRLGDGLFAEAVSHDGIVEAIYMKNRSFLHGVQWHPERTLGDGYSKKLFDAFICAAGAKGATKK